MDLLTFDLNLLVVLHTLLSERSVSRAAERLGLSQPATSAALNRLRKALNDPILVRDGLQMMPTSRAEQLVEPIGAILAEIEQTLAPPEFFNPGTITRTFRIGATDYGVFILIPELMRRLDAIASSIAVEVWDFPPDVNAALLSGDIDLAISHAWALRHCKCTEALFAETYTCLVRQNHPRIRDKLTLNDYLQADHALVTARGRVTGSVDAALERQGLQRRVRLALPHILAVPAVIASTDLVVTLASRVANRFAAEYRLKTFAPPIELENFNIAVAWHPRMTNDPAILWLRHQLIAGQEIILEKPL